MARERYLVGAGEDTIHSGVIELKTAKDKRANWWFYHKKHLFVGILVGAMVISMVYSIVSKVEPDYTIGMITSYSLPSAVLEELEKTLAPYADDRNGDGKVVVQVSEYVFGSDTADPQALQAAYARFAGDVTMGSCMIYIHDEGGFSALKGDLAGLFQYNDGTPMPEGAKDYDKAMRSWSEFEALKDFTAQGSELANWTPEVIQTLCGRLRLSMRTAVGTNIEGNEKKMAYYEDSAALYQRLLKGELPQKEGESEK